MVILSPAVKGFLNVWLSRALPTMMMISDEFSRIC
jgi:hypothetical protein